MSLKAIAVGLAALAWAVPASAQERGSIEFGGFGAASTFDKSSYGFANAFGGGLRAGLFFDPNWSAEGEYSRIHAGIANDAAASVSTFSARALFVPGTWGNLQFIVGAGGGLSSPYSVLNAYTVDALAGVKYALTDNAAVRLDVLGSWLPTQGMRPYQTFRAGLVVYRHPNVSRTIELPGRTVVVEAPPVRDDAANAELTRRLRERDAELARLRDSLSRVAATRSALVMEDKIHFAFDRFDLNDDARAVLDNRVSAYKANPTLNVTIVGYTDQYGSESYNLALGERRAQAAKAYLIAHGVPAEKISISSRGEAELITREPGKAAQAPNRRDEIRITVTP